ncbi:MAG: 23S rRNA (guanosine(2251)-2'-O)-methyltransferase RlmB [Alphaproteobacteria bacterium]
MYLYGYHTCRYALLNPNRIICKIIITNYKILDSLPHTNSKNIVETDLKTLESKLPKGAIHQGIAIEVEPLPILQLEDIIDPSLPYQRFALLDQITDPHNIGSIFRSAAVFSISAIITTKRHTPKETGVLAKSASGAIDIIPWCIVTNLFQTLKTLKQHGFWCFGLDEKGKENLADLDFPTRIAFILGSEGKGLRHLTSSSCDGLISIPTNKKFPTLNVSNAAATCFYEIYKQHKIR